MNAPALELFRGDECNADALPIRGVMWVLCCFAAATVLCVSATILTGFGYQLAAERALSRAAAAGVGEAALPRATNRSVEAAVHRQLADHLALNRSTKIRLERDGYPVRGVVHPQAGSLISVTLSAPVASAMPVWLSRAMPWQLHPGVVVRAHCEIKIACP